jgi:GNAT superfamily N-acetyltransferase
VKLEQHILEHPDEKTPISDTARSLAGKPRTRSPFLDAFIPIGHISLDFYHPDQSLADPTKGIFYISTFYVSHALQGGGIGRAAMDAVENMAIEPPLCAKVLALDTLAREQALDADFWKDVQWQMPKVSRYLVDIRCIMLISVDEQSRLVRPPRLPGI